jgi:RNA polymerase sigma-70 factor (ECF subfamily)
VTRRDEPDQRERFEALFRQTRGDVLAYALRRTRSPEDAADVLAETYLIAWRKIGSIPHGEEARLWLFGVARNVLRRGAVRERALNAMVEQLAHELHTQEATAPRAQDALGARMQAALRSLPERQREVVLLSAWEGLAPREIAAVTRTPVNVVRVRLHRARVRLRRAISPNPPRVGTGNPPLARSRQGEGCRRSAARLRPPRRADEAPTP